MSYDVDDYFEEVIKPSEDFESLLDNARNKSSRPDRIHSLVRGLLEVAGDGSISEGVHDFFTSSYGIGADQFFAIYGDHLSTTIVGKPPYKLRFEVPSSDNEDYTEVKGFV